MIIKKLIQRRIILKNKLFLCLIGCLFFAAGVLLNAKDYKAEIAQLPTTDSYTALLKAVGEETGNNFIIEAAPMARTIYLIENKQVDISGPGLWNPDLKNPPVLNHDIATTGLIKIPLVLYTNKNKPISIDELKKGNAKNYKIEANATIFLILDFQAQSTSSIDATLQKVANGTIDGFIETQSSGDPVLKNLNLKNIKREQYGKFDIVLRIQKGTKAGELDKVLTSGISKLKANGKFDKIMDTFIKQSTYIDWQP
jgi:polar amino acid transport system substrate-binding protein